LAVLQLVLIIGDAFGRSTTVGLTVKKLMKMEARTVMTMMKITKAALA